MTIELQNLKKWTHPDSYIGETYYEYYPVYSRNRDSGPLENSNFEAILKELGGESETVINPSFSHWMVGWIEVIMIHESDEKSLTIADELLSALEEYPALDESDYFQRELEEKQEIWRWCNLKERIELCRKADVSIFAARSDDMPRDVDQYINL